MCLGHTFGWVAGWLVDKGGSPLLLPYPLGSFATFGDPKARVLPFSLSFSPLSLPWFVPRFLGEIESPLWVCMRD